MLDTIRRRAVAGIAMRGPCLARARARPAFPLPSAVREILAWRERGQADGGLASTYSGSAEGSPPQCSLP